MLFRDNTQSRKSGTVIQARDDGDDGGFMKRERTIHVGGYLFASSFLLLPSHLSPNSPFHLLNFRSVSCHTCVLWISWAPHQASSGTSVSVPYPRIPFQAQQLSSSFCCSYSKNIDLPRDRGLPQSLLTHCSLASLSHDKIRRGKSLKSHQSSHKGT